MGWSTVALLMLLSGDPSDVDGPNQAKIPNPDQEKIGRQASAEAKRRAARKKRKTPRSRRRDPEGLDGCRLPQMGHPSVQREPGPGLQPLMGWSAEADAPRFSDRRRRPLPAPLQEDWGRSLAPGEKLYFDIYFSGNPSGQAEAGIGERIPDPRGSAPRGAPMMRLYGKATTTGIVGMIATVTDEMVSIVDARTGASVENVNLVTQGGLLASYKRRDTITEYEGRGHVRIVDAKDGKIRQLALEDGERASTHTLDATALLRVEVIGRGLKRPDQVPSIAAGLGIGADQIRMVEGTLTRVDKYDQPIPGKRKFTFRAYLSADARNIPLLLESDLWLGVIRLSLARYDPPAPRPVAGSTPPEDSPPPTGPAPEGGQPTTQPTTRERSPAPSRTP